MASDPQTYTVAQQFDVAIARQQAGTPFDAPLEPIWRDFFNQGVTRTEAALTYSTSLQDEDRARLLSLLAPIRAKGHELFDNGTMDTNAYHYLHLLMADVLTQEQMVANKNTYAIRLFIRRDITRPLGHEDPGISYDQPDHFTLLWERFMLWWDLKKNHSDALHAHLVKTCPDGSESIFVHPTTQQPITNLNLCWHPPTEGFFLLVDAFLLPIVGSAQESNFSFAAINQAYAHRIVCSAIPTEAAMADGNLKLAIAFLIHDHEHGSIFRLMDSGPVKAFSPSTDPLLKVLHPLWKAIQAVESKADKSIFENVYFMTAHEGNWRLPHTPSSSINASEIEAATQKTPNLGHVKMAYSADPLIHYSRLLDLSGTVIIDILDQSVQSDSVSMRVSPEHLEQLRIRGFNPYFYIGTQHNIHYDPTGDIIHVGLGWAPERVKKTIFNIFGFMVENGIPIPSALQDANGNVRPFEDFDAEAARDYIQNVIYTQFMDFRRTVITA